MLPAVVRRGNVYLSKRGYFDTLVLEDAMTFDSPEDAAEFVAALFDITIEYLATANAREDQEFAMQLEELRG